jgi:3-methyladenine DNA glycosylase Tag
MASPPHCAWVPLDKPDYIAYHDTEWGFVGSTIMYAYMQAAGLVDDHMQGCFKAVQP